MQYKNKGQLAPRRGIETSSSRLDRPWVKNSKAQRAKWSRSAAGQTPSSERTDL